MNITSKFIYAKTKAAFQQEIPNIPANLNPIVFIEDTREMWTMGTYFSIGYPAITVTETTGVIDVAIGNSSFSMETSGASLSIQKGTGNKIILSSTGLTKVDTIPPLEWDNVTKRLLHSVSGAAAGSYGQASAAENASILNIPYFTVNTYGHITSVSTKIVSIRDYVEQLAPNELLGDRNVLISYNEANSNSDTAQVRKARGLTYNSLSQILTVGGGAIINGATSVTGGDLTVTGGDIIGNLRGNVTGEATPKIHTSILPEYGGASLGLYGHVKLLDVFGAEAPSQSSISVDTGNASITNGMAASPYLVWNVKNTLHNEIINAPSIGAIDIGEDSIEIIEHNQRIEIIGQQGINAKVEEGQIIIKGIDIKSYNESEQVQTITNQLTFSKDFVSDSENSLSLRWMEIIQ